MKPLPQFLRSLLRVLGVIAPPLAARIAERLFWYLGKPAPVRSKDTAVHERARIDHIELGDKRVAVYKWGTGPQTVLVVHGWRSRASRLASVIEALERPDRTIVSFDAPGNGASTGTRTNLLEYAAIITELAQRNGRIEAIVAHSSGVLASFLAMRGGVQAGRLVSISGSYSWGHIFAAFVRASALPRRAADALHRRILSTTFGHLADPPRHFLAETDPTDTSTELLVIHDEFDGAVGVEEGRLIADAHNGPTELVLTAGLGHSRILDDAGVIAKVSAFVASGLAQGEPGQEQRDDEPGGEIETQKPFPALVRRFSIFVSH